MTKLKEYVVVPNSHDEPCIISANHYILISEGLKKQGLKSLRVITTFNADDSLEGTTRPTESNMKEVLPNIFAVEVPNDAKDFGCVHVYHGEDVLYFPDKNGETQPIANAPCHCDQVEILFSTKFCTEEQAESVVDSNWDTELGAIWHELKKDNLMARFLPSEALQSLLRSHGLDENKNYLLLKKIP